MPYNNIVSRTDAGALIPEEVSDVMLTNIQNQAAYRMFPSIRMSRGQTRLPVLSALPIAYFVNGDTGLKQTTEVNWANKFLQVEEIAVIVPVPENVLMDSDFDSWGVITPLIEQAAARTFDAAIFFGVNKPASFPAAIAPGAVAAGNSVQRGTNTTAMGGIAGDISDVMSKVEQDGFETNGVIATTGFKGRIRNTRDLNGQPLLEDGKVYGMDTMYPMRGLWPTGTGAAELIAGDFTQGVVGIRQDVSYKVLDQAVIQDNTGAIIFNLAQQDMVALRMTFRVAFQVSNQINWDNMNDATRFPWGVLTSP